MISGRYALVLVIVGFLVSFLSGCTTLSYYGQSIAGQLNILQKRQSIEELLQDKQTPPKLKQKLASVLEIRDFATDELALPNNGSYRSYADIGRRYVVWNVFAAPEFSLQLKEWCFLIAGCVRYRGYFAEQNAEHFAAGLRKQDLDVYVTGIEAYSTLGWFDDPLLNTVINRSDAQLAGLIFHELAHQVLYVKNDTAFNEGFALTVELEGVQRWMQTHGTPQKLQQYRAGKKRRKDFFQLISRTQDKLSALYASQQPEQVMREEKQQIFDQMYQAYLQLKTQWDGYSGYDTWFKQPANNAKLASVTTYTDYVPAFRTLLRKNNGDFTAFYRAAKKIAALPEDKRTAAMKELLTQQTNG
jgi:predicted aminopeptidase